MGVIGGLDWHPSGRELGFSLNSARSPTDAYSVDVQQRRADPLDGERDWAGWCASELSEPSLVRWPSFDGRTISGFLYRPPARFTGRRPVIINIHGGPEGQSLPAFQGRSNYFLNELGVAIIYPNVRGSHGVRQDVRQAGQRDEARRVACRTSARCWTGSPRSRTWTPRG